MSGGNRDKKMQFPKQLNELFSKNNLSISTHTTCRATVKIDHKKKKAVKGIRFPTLVCQYDLFLFLVIFLISFTHSLSFISSTKVLCTTQMMKFPKFTLRILKNIEMHNINTVHLKLAKRKDSQYDLKRAKKAFKPKTNVQHSPGTQRSLYHTFKMQKKFRVPDLILCIENPFRRICQSNWTAYLPCSLVQRGVRTKIPHTIICQQMCLDQ